MLEGHRLDLYATHDSLLAGATITNLCCTEDICCLGEATGALGGKPARPVRVECAAIGIGIGRVKS